MNEEKLYTKERDIISIANLTIPIIIVLLLTIFLGSHVFTRWWFRLMFTIFSGCWGLAMRGIYLRTYSAKENPFPFYITLYPLVVIMNGLLIYVLLSLFKPFNSHLFFAAALPLGMYLGFFSHPGTWIIRQLVEKMEKVGDLPPIKKGGLKS